MKTIFVMITALAALGCMSADAGAKEYQVKNIGKGGLKASCARGGGSFSDGENSYACTYENGNIRECSKRDGHCIVVTPPKREAGQGQTGVFGDFAGAGVGTFN